MLHCTQHDKSASYIIPNMQRSIHHPVYKTGKYPNCYNERQKMVHYMHIIPYSIPTFMHLCDKS